jgi:uncharacterized protein (TIRG00374 family)
MWKKIRAVLKSTPFNIAAIFGLTFLVLYISMKDDGDQVFEALSRVNIWWLLGIILLMVFERYLLGWGLALECRLTHPKYTVNQGFVNSYVAGLFNNITPGASGGQIAQGYIFRKQGIPVSNSVGVLWLDFIVYQSTMCAFVFFLILFKFPYFYANYSQFFLIVIFGFLVGAAVIVFLSALALSPKFYTWLTTTGINIGCKLHLVKDKQKTLANLDLQLAQFSKEIVVLRTHRKMIAMLATEDLLRLLIYYSVPFLCAKALGLSVSGDMFFDMLALASFVAMVNAFLPMPGSSGGTEATFILMYSTLFTKAEATSIMILWRFVTFYQVLVVGAVVFMIAKTKKEVPLEESKVPTTYQKKALESEGIK